MASDNIGQTITICNFLLSKRHRYNELLLEMKSSFYMLSIDTSVNGEDLPEVEAKSDLHRKKEVMLSS